MCKRKRNNEKQTPNVCCRQMRRQRKGEILKKLITTIAILSALTLCCACQKQDIQGTELSSEAETTVLTESAAENDINADTATHEHVHNENEETEGDIIVEVERKTSIETETASRPAELPTLDHAVNSDIDEGHSEGDFHGFLIIRGGIRKDTYYTTIAGDGSTAQTVVDSDNSAAYFRYDNYHVYADHNQASDFLGLTSVKEGSQAMLLDDNSNIIERYVCVRVCYGYNYGHLFDDTMTDLANLTDGTILMYTCTDSPERILMTFWDVVDSFGDDSDWVFEQMLSEQTTAEE